MTLVPSPAVDKALRKYREAARWIARWRTTAEHAVWDSLADVRKAYPSADGVKNSRGAIVTIFNVKGGNYRLLTVINYSGAAVYEIDLLSHSDYDKNAWKEWLT